MPPHDPELAPERETPGLPSPPPETPSDDAEIMIASSPAASTNKPVTTCTFCGEEFPTRSSMFRHLERPSETCPAPREDSGQKVLLLVGYDSCAMIEAGLGRATGPPTQLMRGGVVGGEGAAAFVLKAMGIGVKRGAEGTAVSGVGGGDNSSARQYCFSRPKGGFSQASSVASRTCPLLAQEPEVSAT